MRCRSFAFIIACVLFPTLGFAAKPTPTKTASPTASTTPAPSSTPLAGLSNAFDIHSDSEPTLIDSDTLSLDAQSRKFEYSGNVKVTHGQMTLTSEKLDGTYSDKNEIQTLTARNNVQVTKPDGTKASGQKAYFDAVAQTVTLTESPQIEQNGSVLTADKITVYLKEDRSEASGQVHVKLIKKAGEGIETALKPR